MTEMKTRLTLVAAMLFAAACGKKGSTSMPVVSGQVDDTFPQPASGPGVPLLPKLQRVGATVDDDRVAVTFQPIAGAKDYRIYPLPAAADISVDGTGFVTLHNATYRCAGDRFAVKADLDPGPNVAQSWTYTSVAAQVDGFGRTQADTRLGFVFVEPGQGLLPVYALGDPTPGGDNMCGIWMWGASRSKKYTTSDSERQRLLAAGWRDDGIVFYVPAAGDVQIQTAELNSNGSTHRLYFPKASAEGQARAGNSPTNAFTALSAQTAGAQPLVRVQYVGRCFNAQGNHDELAAGDGWYERLATQGNQPVFEVQWAGLTRETTFAVEALDRGCPFQGHLSAQSRPAFDFAHPFLTIADVRAASATGEVFLNGQHDSGSKPRAVARSFVKVSPAPRPTRMDWQDGFGAEENLLAFTLQSTPPESGGWNPFLDSPGYTAQFYTISTNTYGLGVVNGELWVTYADAAADTTAKFRLTPKTTATMASGSFVHATMMTELWATGRRYPQVLISDRPSPVQDTLAQGVTVIGQIRAGWPWDVELQLCDHRTWDTNNQCPHFHIQPNQVSAEVWPPTPMASEHGSPMRLGRFDLYVSRERAYLTLDGVPYGCANLPAAPAAGPVTVTFGDVLYHSAVDEAVVRNQQSYPFLHDHQLTETRRIFDNLGFSSGQSAPGWNEALVPCTSKLEN
jgi:hypothetical protein